MLDRNQTLLTDQCSDLYMMPWATVITLTICYLMVMLCIFKKGKRLCLPVPDNLFLYQKHLRQLRRELSRLVVDDNSIEILGNPLAYTAHYTLFRGTMVPQVKRRTSERISVAVKVSYPSPKHSVALLDESARIYRLSHPNISRVVAISHLSFSVLRPLVAIEWLAGGNLADYFQHQIRDCEARERPLVLLRDMLGLLMQISVALKYFHETLGDMSHGAVTTQNVQLACKDLKRCAVKLSYLYPPTTSRLPPEILYSTEINPKIRQESDICFLIGTCTAEFHIDRMFGVLCWECMTLGAEPHYQRTPDEIQRWSLVIECLSDAHRRPRFTGSRPTLVDRIQQLRAYYAQSMDCINPVPNTSNCTCVEHKCKRVENFDRE
ncbi:hypothetical protein DICVIV_00951 [Dictyocaulus viviparus]|uniref:Protein kinase domain-containing protein n=1 Tax=Dictyocaulus viviparus TaxID=29172 RepID=A0A0D8Y853_DICVI|nr:hypothetical protein DICVIV_00951 [Dictyocaulus viviparus]